MNALTNDRKLLPPSIASLAARSDSAYPKYLSQSNRLSSVATATGKRRLKKIV